jgi:C4-dicarboxylate transporter, DctQ subunit
MGDSMTPTGSDIPVFDALFEIFCKKLAIIGGVVLVLMSISTFISVMGRYFFDSPIVGDSEIVKMLTGVAVSLCLPYCHMRYGNVIVDVFTVHSPGRFKATLDLIGSLMLAVLALLLAWQTCLGAVDAYNYDNETMMLRLKEWWFYIIIAGGLFMLSIAGFVVSWRHFTTIKKG